MTHATEAELARAAELNDAAARADYPELFAHLTRCVDCQSALDAQRAARQVLAARPIIPIRDLSAAIRARLEADFAPQHWFDFLNWRVLSLRAAPVALAIVLAAFFTVRAISSTAADASTSAAVSTAAANTSTSSASASGLASPASPHLVSTLPNNSTVVSALWNDKVSDDQLMTLFLRARPDDALSEYVQEQ